MKKSISLLLALILILSMSTIVFAADIEEDNGTKSGEVTASYKAGKTGGTVISVVIAWDGLNFVYNGESQRKWDPVNHVYTGEDIPNGWESSNGTITITNDSNTFLEASFSYVPESGFGDAGVVLNVPNIDGTRYAYIGNAANEMGDNGKGVPQTTTFSVVPTGVLSDAATTSTKIGTITITIKDALALNDMDMGGFVSELKVYCDYLYLLNYPNSYVLKYGDIYTESSLLSDADDKLDAAVDAVANGMSEIEQIQAVNAAIAALNSTCKIKK